VTLGDGLLLSSLFYSKGNRQGKTRHTRHHCHRRDGALNALEKLLVRLAVRFHERVVTLWHHWRVVVVASVASWTRRSSATGTRPSAVACVTPRSVYVVFADPTCAFAFGAFHALSLPFPSILVEALAQPPILRFQLLNKLDQLLVLVPKKRQLLNFRRTDERMNVMNVLSRPLRQIVDSIGERWRLHTLRSYLRKEKLYRALVDALQGFYQENPRRAPIQSSTNSVFSGVDQTMQKRQEFRDQLPLRGCTVRIR